MLTVFKTMLTTSLRDKISLFYATLFPVALLIGLGLYFDSPDYRPILLTGVMALSSLFWALQGIAFQVMEQRKKGVYKLLQLAPYPVVSFILTMTLARTLLGIGMNLLLLLTGFFVFGIKTSLIGLLLLIAVLAVGSLCFTCIGFLISNIARNEAQINMYSNLLYLPMIFTSEAFYSLNGAPDWIVTIGRCFPISHFVEGLRFALNANGTGILMPLLILIGFSAGAVLLSTLTFRWDSEQAVVSKN